MSKQRPRRIAPWSWQSHSGKARRRAARPAGRTAARLGMESLERRLALSGTPVFSGPAGSIQVLEGDAVNVTFEFTDALMGGGGGSIGLNPAAFDDPDAFTTFHPTSDVTIDTATLDLIDVGPDGFFGSSDDVVVGSLAGVFYTVPAQGDLLAYEIAVVAVDQITIPAGVTVRAVGPRPLALLSTGDITIAGTLDLSAQQDVNYFDPVFNARLAGAGGGDGSGADGGLNWQPEFVFDEDEGFILVWENGYAAAGAPASSVGRHAGNAGLEQGGGGGGAHGGLGGPGFLGSLGSADLALAGTPFGDFAVGITGGSGGGGATNVAFPVYIAGGGGGGGIELGALGTITISGSVLANGGDGVDPAAEAGNGSGGGGAGGGILIHGVDVAVSGTLSAAGGDSRTSPLQTGFGGGGGGGRIVVSASGT
ncbi:MAG TPA: hypothetical protein PKC18_15330, partial [Lacipirellulaceae bacterium]|nr:hypothetical protein [Lacipirellulaceae bacterium]